MAGDSMSVLIQQEFLLSRFLNNYFVTIFKSLRVRLSMLFEEPLKDTQFRFIDFVGLSNSNLFREGFSQSRDGMQTENAGRL